MSNYIQEVNQQIDIERLLIDRIGYGHNLDLFKEKPRIFCIFKPHNTPDLQINKETRGYKCFNCEVSGDYVNLYARHKGITDIEAAKELDDESLSVVPAKRSSVSSLTTQEKSSSLYSEEDVMRCWSNATKEGVDTYFKSKKLPVPPIAKCGQNPYGYYATLIPKVNINGEFRGFEALSENGKFQFKIDGNEVRFSLLGKLKDGEPFIIGEGIATVQTMWEICDRAVSAVAAGTRSNMLNVVEAIKAKYPNAQPIILADLKDGKPEAKALEVKEKYPDAIIMKPSFEGLGYKGEKKPNDINDLISKCGLTMEQAKERITEHKDEQIQPAKKTTIDSEFAYLLENNSEAKLIEELKNIAPGIETGYKIGDVNLAFPGGAISIIAAPTSHGKTTALINFTLGTLEKNPEKCAYFFSYEESASAIQMSFINTWISRKINKISANSPALSQNNKRSIESYFRGKDEYINQNLLYDFKREKESFFNELVNTGRLKGVYTNLKADKLVEAVRFIKDKDPNAGLICIDYMQLLKAEKPRSSRQEELKQICLMLKDCAVETGLPIVLTAQFNRTVMSEEDLSPVNIGEAGDIERVANLIIGMFNRNYDKMNKAGNTGKNGNTIEKESAIYFEVLKNRNGSNGHNCVMDFDGNKGLILNQAPTKEIIKLPSDNIKKQKNEKTMLSKAKKTTGSQFWPEK